MKKTIFGALAAMAMAFSPSVVAQNQLDRQVILKFHTTIYDNLETENAFHFELGATEPMYVDVDCGYGLTEMEVGVAKMENGDIVGSTFSGSVSSNGIVTVYGDPSKIDYVMLEGLYMTELDCSNLTNVEILNVKYNELESLDLSHMTKLMALYADANPCNVKPMVIGSNKPNLAILSLSMVGNLDSSFCLSDYPNIQSFQAYDCPTLINGDTSKCPKLKQFSVDGSAISKVDFSNNPELLIVNVSYTNVHDIDLSPCYNLTEFYGVQRKEANDDEKFKSIDLSNNPNLQRLFLSDNSLTEIDLTNNTVLTDLYINGNLLTHIDVSHLTRLLNLSISNNYFVFSTLPAPSTSYFDYIYFQRDMQVDRSYKVGTVLDFSDKVLREGTTTKATLYTYKATTGVLTPAASTAYTYADGKITLNEVLSDSCVVQFTNSLFPECTLSTTRFMVKSEENFGKPSAAASLRFANTVANPAFSIGIAGATVENPKTFYVDFGSGVLESFTTTTNMLSAQANATGSRAGTITIYTAEGDELTAIGVEGQRLLSVDFSSAHSLEYLKLSDCQLPSIVLQYNRLLRTLDLSGNNLASLSLLGVNEMWSKLRLTDINLSNNVLTTLNADIPTAWRYLNIANNKMTTLPYDKLKNLLTLDISNNDFAQVALNDAEALEVFKAGGNHLMSIIIPDYVPLKELDLSNNDFTFETLPAAGSFAKYTYAPQNAVILPESAPVVSLFDYLYAANGTPTTFTWYSAATNQPVESGLITNRNGNFTFTSTAIGSVYCSMTNAAFPDFQGETAYKTTVVEPSEVPQYVWGSFKTLQTGVGQLSIFATKERTSVYIDWGNGLLEPYQLTTTVRHFDIPVTAGAEVKCYSLTEDNNVACFSMVAGKLEYADFSKLDKVTTFALDYSALPLDKISMPSNSGLKELRLDGNEITDISSIVSTYRSLQMLSVNENKLKQVDISGLNNLIVFYAGYNQLESVTMDNRMLNTVALVGNNLSELDLSKLPSLEQLFVFDNKFEHLDLLAAPTLRVVNIEQNRFTFTTLPVDNGYDIYGYANQAPYEVVPVDGKVDLSGQLKVGDTFTTYTWYKGVPVIDSATLELGGELLPTDAYWLEDGVTKFKESTYGVTCVMQNAVFPKLYLCTPLLDIDVTGIADAAADSVDYNATVVGNDIVVTAPADAKVMLTDLNGRVIATATGATTFANMMSGMYIVNVAEHPFKLAVK